jgi:hypothetical protein
MAKRETVYIVWGSSGEYEDHEEHIAAIFRDKTKAEAHCLKAKQRSAALHAEYGRSWYRYAKDHPRNRFDPNMENAGTDYCVVKETVRS